MCVGEGATLKLNVKKKKYRECHASALIWQQGVIRSEEKKEKASIDLDLLLHLTIEGCPNIVNEREARR